MGEFQGGSSTKCCPELNEIIVGLEAHVNERSPKVLTLISGV
jgi:hypothetical protein